MAITKEEFVVDINTAIEEAKEIYDGSRNANMGDSYASKLALSKVDRLFVLLNELVYSRINSMSEKEIEKYKNEKIAVLVNEVNRLMLDLEKNSENLTAKTRIEELLSLKAKLESENIEDVRNRLIQTLKLFLDYSTGDKQIESLRNIYRDKETFEEFIKLLEEYRSIENEIKMLELERKIIAKDLLPNSANYSFTRVDLDTFLTLEGLNKLEEEISVFIQKSTEEEMFEQENFGDLAKRVFIDTLNIESPNPLDKEALEFLKSRLLDAPRLYDKAKLELEEWEILTSKTFKTHEINSKISTLEKEIKETKEEINKALKNWYNTYYSNNNMYKPISTRINEKFIYYMGYEYLNDFILYGQWPTEDKLKLLSATRKLNRKEAEKQILKIEIVKSKHSNIFTSYISEREIQKQKIKEQMQELVGEWQNPLIMQVINNYYLNQENVKREKKARKEEKNK